MLYLCFRKHNHMVTYPYVDCLTVLISRLDEDELVDAKFVSDAGQAPIERHAMTATQDHLLLQYGR